MKTDLQLKLRLELTKTLEDVQHIDDLDEMIEKYNLKIKLRGSKEELKLFHKHSFYKELQSKGVKLDDDPLPDHFEETIDHIDKDRVDDKESTSFNTVLRNLVKLKSKAVRDIYSEIYGETLEDVGEGGEDEEETEEIIDDRRPTIELYFIQSILATEKMQSGILRTLIIRFYGKRERCTNNNLEFM
jgi:hypothetical protein